MVKNNLKVIKRDGRLVKFNPSKITNAIVKAMLKVNCNDYDEAYTITNNIVDHILYNYNDKIDIEDIEKLVEVNLMTFDKDVAREYTSYRAARDASRTRSSRLVKKINGLLDNTDPEITAENANKDVTKLYVQRDILAGTVAKEITKDLNLIPARVEKACVDNYLHWHDRDYSPLFDMYNCMLIDYKTMLKKGFIIGNALVETPKSFGVCCTLLSQIIQGVASSQYGGQTLNRLDEGIAPYVTRSYVKILNDKINDIMKLYNIDQDIKIEYYEDMNIESYNDYINAGKFLQLYNDDSKEIIYNLSEETKDIIIKTIVKQSMKKIEKEVYDGIQCLEYQINTLYTTNGQTP